MKKYLLIFLLLFSLQPLYPDQFTQRQVIAKSVTSSGFVSHGDRNVTFIFSSDFTGTIQAVAFAGSADKSLTLSAESQDVLGDIYYTVTGGTLRIIEVR